MDVKADKPLAAEEKLLRLIRKPAKKDAADLVAPKKSSLSISKTHNSSADPVRMIQRVLMFVFLVSVIWVGYRYFTDSSKEMAQRELDQLMTEAKQAEKGKEQPVLDIRPLNEYIQGIQSRDAFRFPWEQTAEDKADSVSTPVVPPLASQIKVKGIMLDTDPKVVLEQVSDGQTMILSIGESINGAVLKDVKEDKLIFSYNNQDVEIVP